MSRLPVRHNPRIPLLGTIGDRIGDEGAQRLAATSRKKVAPPPTLHIDDLAVDKLAAAMKDKLRQCREEGKGGWDDPGRCSQERLAMLLGESLTKGSPVNVANFAAMLFSRGAAPSLIAEHAMRALLRGSREDQSGRIAKLDAELLQVIDERDRYHAKADALADAIAKHLQIEIGEHSSANCPWMNALESIKAAPSTPVKSRAPITDAEVAAQPARGAIDGAIAFGRMGFNKPEDGHWLMEYWHIGRQLAKLGETSPWDNQTPLDSQPSEARPAYIDLEGLAEKLLAPREITRTAEGYLAHPALPVCDESTRYDLLLAALGLETACVDMESDCADQAILARYFDGGDPDCNGWTPTPPTGDGWVLLEIYPTEDGPYALFTRRKPKEPRMSRRERQAASAAARDGERFRGITDTMVALLNEQPLTPVQQKMTGMLDELEVGSITIDHVRAAIDAALAAQRKGGAA